MSFLVLSCSSCSSCDLLRTACHFVCVTCYFLRFLIKRNKSRVLFIWMSLTMTLTTMTSGIVEQLAVGSWTFNQVEMKETERSRGGHMKQWTVLGEAGCLCSLRGWESLVMRHQEQCDEHGFGEITKNEGIKERKKNERTKDRDLQYYQRKENDENTNEGNKRKQNREAKTTEGRTKGMPCESWVSNLTRVVSFSSIFTDTSSTVYVSQSPCLSGTMSARFCAFSHFSCLFLPCNGVTLLSGNPCFRTLISVCLLHCLLCFFCDTFFFIFYVFCVCEGRVSWMCVLGMCLDVTLTAILHSRDHRPAT